VHEVVEEPEVAICCGVAVRCVVRGGGVLEHTELEQEAGGV
jgi:hypothetical protein